ncbi:MAG: restriction endonuclease [Deltaproteobacteria bacterium]|nr:restriction endonuclease [Deltaproteobacteria bacterium]
MVDTIFCKSCGILLHEDPGQEPNLRKPCPNCGSLDRVFNVNLRESIKVSADLRAEIKIIPPAPLLLSTIVVPGEKTKEGLIIEAVAIPWFEIIEFLKHDWTLAYEIPSYRWEEIIAGAYKRSGFEEVTLTPRSGDRGRDVIAIKKAIGLIRVIDQVKAYAPGHLVKADDVRALVGVLHGDGASKGFLTTTSDFAPKIREDPLIVPFMPSRLELITGEMLKTRLQTLAEGRMP